MSYAVRLTPGAETDLVRLDSHVRRRVVARVRWLADHFDDVRPAPLSAAWQGYYRLRVGDWRLIYKPDRDSRVITVYRIAHRREVYLD